MSLEESLESVDLVRVARAWMSADPDPDARASTQRMIDNEDMEALEACFGARLQFGTAGLRGPLAPGPSGMNSLQVRQVSLGLAK